jgi:hypothetical protein
MDKSKIQWDIMRALKSTLQYHIVHQTLADRFPQYDFLIEKGDGLYKVKVVDDPDSKETKALSIEWCYGSPGNDIEIASGIQITDAVLWFHQCYDPEPVIFTATVDYLRTLIGRGDVKTAHKFEEYDYVYTYKQIPISICFEDKFISWYRA